MIDNSYYSQDVHGPYELHDIGNLEAPAKPPPAHRRSARSSRKPLRPGQPEEAPRLDKSPPRLGLQFDRRVRSIQAAPRGFLEHALARHGLAQ